MFRSITLCWFAILAAACSESGPEPWSAAEMSALSEKFSHIAEAYAVVDICMPMIDQNKDAKRSVISKIEIRHYSQLSQMDTEAELANFFAHHRQSAGTDEQAATLERIYRESHQAAARLLTSLDGCVETTSDYANTILNTKVRSNP
ncbi:MAG: hypothetical protein IH885_08215 [Myxococcales bacterium]|nr:hypothetical protein [Myxococcales bacterium]